MSNEVVCTRKTPWNLVFGKWDHTEKHPEYNGLYHIRFVIEVQGVEMYSLCEYPPLQIYDSKWFEPVMTNGELESLLEEKSTLLTI